MYRPEPVPPESDGLATDVNAAFVQQVFEIPRRRWKPDLEHPSQSDDLGFWY